MSVVAAEAFDNLREKGWRKIEQPTSSRVFDEECQFKGIIKVPLREFASDNIVLVSDKPVEITIMEDEGQLFASSETLNIDAFGENIQSLISDFSQHVIYFYKYYNNLSEEQVMGNALRLKNLYQTHFTKIE